MNVWFFVSKEKIGPAMAEIAMTKVDGFSLRVLDVCYLASDDMFVLFLSRTGRNDLVENELLKKWSLTTHKG